MQAIGLRYLSFTMLYGTVHSAVHAPTYFRYTNRHTGKTATQPVLLTHQFLNVLSGCVIGPFAWPCMVYRDLTMAECALRGRDPADYGEICIKD